MTLPSSNLDPLLNIHQSLNQYPILRTRMRSRMRKELFSRGIISSEEFKIQVREQAISSQAREGMTNPFGEEPEDIWRTRLARVRTYLTDFHFAYNLSFELFEDIVRSTLEDRGAIDGNWIADFNAELAPPEFLIEKAQQIALLAKEDQKVYRAPVEELKVVMIRNMISDQLAYIKIAKKWFTLEDLLSISERKIGMGKVGGKAAGMLLAQRIIQKVGDEDLKKTVRIPESYFLAADVMYAYMANNNLMRWADQKYESVEQIREEEDILLEEYLKGNFPPDIEDELQIILDKIAGRPMIVRSSSLLEDNFGTSFAGKYESHFLPNQGNPEENFRAFIRAIQKIYASVLYADPLLYRRSKDLVDYDERIAILIQVVEGEQIGDYYLPHAAGVAFSNNLYRWSPQIKKEDGFLRLVWGLGTRAVDRVGDDFPRMVALSHPMLHTHSDARNIYGYSQKMVDLIDLKDNVFKSLPIEKVFHRRYPIMRYIAQNYEHDYLSPIRSNLIEGDISNLVITFDEMLRRTPLADKMRRILTLLEKEYRSPVDMEFTVKVQNPNTTAPDVSITILQCRPQSFFKEIEVEIPKDLPQEDIFFTTNRVLTHGQVSGIDYVLYVDAEGYFKLPTSADRFALGRIIGVINDKLQDETFICVGPGRWGTINPDLGVRVGYSDIYHSKALIELSGKEIGSAPEPSFGTHFFQDLIEAQIFPIAVYLDDKDIVFNREFLDTTPNLFPELYPDDKKFFNSIRLLKVEDYRPDSKLELIINDDESKAVAYFVKNETGENPEDISEDM